MVYLQAFSMEDEKFSQDYREKGEGRPTVSSKFHLEIPLEVITLRKQIHDFLLSTLKFIAS